MLVTIGTERVNNTWKLKITINVIGCFCFVWLLVFFSSGSEMIAHVWPVLTFKRSKP